VIYKEHVNQLLKGGFGGCAVRIRQSSAGPSGEMHERLEVDKLKCLQLKQKCKLNVK
jgi:hypothetical protein